jgi:hypothetical protein
MWRTLLGLRPNSCQVAEFAFLCGQRPLKEAANIRHSHFFDEIIDSYASIMLLTVSSRTQLLNFVYVASVIDKSS